MVANDAVDTIHAFEGVPLKSEEDEEKQKEETQLKKNNGSKKTRGGLLDKELSLLWNEYENMGKSSKTFLRLVLLIWGSVWILFMFSGHLSPSSRPQAVAIRLRDSDRSWSVRRVRETSQESDLANTNVEGAEDFAMAMFSLEEPKHYHQSPADAIMFSGHELSFAKVTRDNNYVLVNYYVLWGEFSQRFRPTWKKLMHLGAGHADKVAFLEVNCEVYKELCREERVDGFPTIRLYAHGKAQMPNYSGDRTLESLNDFLQRRLDGIIEDTVPRADDHDAVVPSQPSAADEMMDLLPLSRLEEVLRTNKYVFVHFVAPKCLWCKKIDPVWEQLTNEGVVFVRVNCETDADTRIKHKITGSTTIRLYVNGKPMPDYKRHRESEYPSVTREPDYLPDYMKMDRTLLTFRKYLVKVVAMNEYGESFHNFNGAKIRFAAPGLDPHLLGVVYYADDDEEQFADDDGRIALLRPSTGGGVDRVEFDAPAGDIREAAKSVKPDIESGQLEPSLIGSYPWDLEIEYAVRARNLEQLWDAGENVMVAFTSSRLPDCASFRPTWHEFAHRAQQSTDLNKLVVAEIDCALDRCPQQDSLLAEFPYYAWYHRGQQVGPSMSCGSQTTVTALLATSSMLLVMEKRHTEILESATPLEARKAASGHHHNHHGEDMQQAKEAHQDYTDDFTTECD